jgi:hypothetical protein
MRALVLTGAVVAVLALPSPASAQRWGRERFPQSGACFYRDVYFEGDYFCVRAGDEVGRLPDDMNDEISSILVFGRAEVTVFKDSRFRGGSERFAYSVDDLHDYDWNDRISSLQVRLPERRDRFGDLNDDQRGRERRADRRDDRRPQGQDVDRIITRAYQDVLGRDPDQGGFRQYRSRIIDDGWTEEQVRNSLRTSPEYREKTTMTRAKAEAIVRSAYLAVLKREPDAAGSQGYVTSVLRDNWSQQDVERELRKSDEFRNRR